jgi:hypothetical protein
MRKRPRPYHKNITSTIKFKNSMPPIKDSIFGACHGSTSSADSDNIATFMLYLILLLIQ